jgi:hypothetical protein
MLRVSRHKLVSNFFNLFFPIQYYLHSCNMSSLSIGNRDCSLCKGFHRTSNVASGSQSLVSSCCGLIGFIESAVSSILILECLIYKVMAGAVKALNTSHCTLVGGHTTEGQELTLGFSITGVAPSTQPLLLKAGMQVGDILVLTKPIGTGTLFAAGLISFVIYAHFPTRSVCPTTPTPITRQFREPITNFPSLLFVF